MGIFSSPAYRYTNEMMAFGHQIVGPIMMTKHLLPALMVVWVCLTARKTKGQGKLPLITLLATLLLGAYVVVA